ncbi:hypothetical protein I1A62_30115 [Rhodococcus sp. USK10]|uniref:LtfC-like domain-containing protein n=1 Tax=Rhodococcus sp. USK10 TaxID=2789739 RepID=UPI001C603FC6|nr:hypothetical protein [Rhodococcus sp. USK10]QYB01485.1 hypothetical protein I1A62_30115 [Rhodococcus sp. USK10]
MLQPWGKEPAEKDMVLNAAEPFVQQVDILDPETKEPFVPPDGSEVYFLLGPKPYTRWDGVLTGAVGRFKIPAAQTEVITKNTVVRFYISHPDGGDQLPYMLTRGKVIRND